MSKNVRKDYHRITYDMIKNFFDRRGKMPDGMDDKIRYAIPENKPKSGTENTAINPFDAYTSKVINTINKPNGKRK